MHQLTTPVKSNLVIKKKNISIEQSNQETKGKVLSLQIASRKQFQNPGS